MSHWQWLHQLTNNLHTCCMSISTKHTYLLRLNSSRSRWNIGRRIVSIWHDRWQYLSHHSSLHPSSPNLLLSYLVMSSFFGLPALLLPPSGIHSKARPADLVAGSRRTWPTNRLLLVATMSCNANCPDRAITSKMENVNHLVDSTVCFPCFTGINPCWNYNGRVQK